MLARLHGHEIGFGRIYRAQWQPQLHGSAPRPRYNIAPGQTVPVVRWHPKKQRRHIDELGWGLIPHWSTDGKPGAAFARADRVTSSPLLRQPFLQRRCLVLATGWYSWARLLPGQPPFAFGLAGERIMAPAALWDGWRAPTGEWFRTCVVLTAEAPSRLARFDERVPVIVDPLAYGVWLGEQQAVLSELLAVLRPPPTHSLTVWPVGPAVKAVSTEGKALLEPMA